VVIVIVVVPIAIADTKPLEETVATSGSEEDHVTFWFVASGG
jgi:hypothetical protein